LHQDKSPSHNSSFIREFFTKNNMIVTPPKLVLSVAPIED
jgi:hypothetical protein